MAEPSPTLDALAAAAPDLLDRAVERDGRAPVGGGELVLYWMRSALRGHENPALDAALALAEASGRPLLAYHGLSERYPFASDRHHTFVLEAARDVADELEARGVAHAVHVERPGHRGDVLRQLARRASAVVTELAPVPPLAGWTRRLADSIQAPVVEVDTSCVLPMPAVEKPKDRAFAFRKATSKDRDARLREPYADRPVRVEPFAGELPFAPVDVRAADLTALVGACEIDHAVGPVPGLRGGARAGYARWEAWKQQGLPRYHRRRNDAADRDGVSRLSPWLHHGMVSPLRVAREAAALPGGGPEKFLDELLIWRELAHVYCFHRAERLHQLDVLPDWAVETLREHEGDVRPMLPSWERLARARTGDPVWDAAQRSLLAHGELHNNLRMTWGKALVGWTPDAATALERLIDLNHRYALDGRDPNSYGGLLWCLGAFDSPKSESPVLGRVRPRPTDAHADRMDLERFDTRTREPAAGAPLRVGVIGAGLAGLAAARTLADHGHQVRVFDKARGPAGRISTRRAEPFAFDHGAQYFTARDGRFRRYVESWCEEGLAARWEGRIAVLSERGLEPKLENPERFVGVPGMHRIAKHLAEGIDVRVRTRIEPLTAPADGQWVLIDEEGQEHGPFDRVVVTAPAAQAAELIGDLSPLGARAAAVEMRACTAAMLAFETPLEVEFDGAFVESDALAWIARDSSKPGRPAGDQWVLHSRADWSLAHWDEPYPAQVAALAAEFARLVGRALPAVAHSDGHRWRYSIAPEPLDLEYLADDERGLVLAGDWLRGGRVEGAFLSGVAAAGHLLREHAARWTDASR